MLDTNEEEKHASKKAARISNAVWCKWTYYDLDWTKESPEGDDERWARAALRAPRSLLNDDTLGRAIVSFEDWIGSARGIAVSATMIVDEDDDDGFVDVDLEFFRDSCVCYTIEDETDDDDGRVLVAHSSGCSHYRFPLETILNESYNFDDYELADFLDGDDDGDAEEEEEENEEKLPQDYKSRRERALVKLRNDTFSTNRCQNNYAWITQKDIPVLCKKFLSLLDR